MLEKDLLKIIENPDVQLVADAQAGDILAEERIIRKYSTLVKRKAKAYFIVGADENDVMQEGMIGLLKAIRKYDPEKNASFATFAELCVTTQIINAIRSANRGKHQPLNSSLSLNGIAMGLDEGSSEGIALEEMIKSDAADSPESMVIIKDVTHYLLQKGTNIFSEFEMQVLQEAMKGYTCEQIAEKLGKTPKSVDNAIQRTKKKVNEYLRK